MAKKHKTGRTEINEGTGVREAVKNLVEKDLQSLYSTLKPRYPLTGISLGPLKGHRYTVWCVKLNGSVQPNLVAKLISEEDRNFHLSLQQRPYLFHTPRSLNYPHKYVSFKENGIQKREGLYIIEYVPHANGTLANPPSMDQEVYLLQTLIPLEKNPVRKQLLEECLHSEIMGGLEAIADVAVYGKASLHLFRQLPRIPKSMSAFGSLNTNCEEMNLSPITNYAIVQDLESLEHILHIENSQDEMNKPFIHNNKEIIQYLYKILFPLSVIHQEEYTTICPDSFIQNYIRSVQWDVPVHSIPQSSKKIMGIEGNQQENQPRELFINADVGGYTLRVVEECLARYLCTHLFKLSFENIMTYAKNFHTMLLEKQDLLVELTMKEPQSMQGENRIFSSIPSLIQDEAEFLYRVKVACFSNAGFHEYGVACKKFVKNPEDYESFIAYRRSFRNLTFDHSSVRPSLIAPLIITPDDIKGTTLYNERQRKKRPPMPLISINNQELWSHNVQKEPYMDLAIAFAKNLRDDPKTPTEHQAGYDQSVALFDSIRKGCANNYIHELSKTLRRNRT